MAITSNLDYVPSFSMNFSGAPSQSSFNYSQFQTVAQAVSTVQTQGTTTQENGNGNGFNFTDMINNPGGAFLLGLVLLGMSGFRG